MKLNQMNILVTGASRGIGAAVAQRLGERGARVIVNYRTREDDAAKVVASIKKYGGQAIAIQADMSQHDEVGVLYTRSVEHFGQVDAVVHSATPALVNVDLLSTQFENIDSYIRVYVHGLLLLAQLCLPTMLERRFGRFVAISSSLVFHPSPRRASYIIGKSALQGLVRSIAVEYGAFGITANTVAASLVPTELVGDMDDRTKMKAANINLLKRLATPDDIAQSVCYLLDETGSFITGITVPVTGGEIIS